MKNAHEKSVESGDDKRPSARKLITDKLRYIANSRGLKMNEAWAAIVAPVVQAEFEACGGGPVKSPTRKG